MADEPPDETAERARRRRAAELLGDTLPDATADESPEGWGDRDDGRGRDASRDAELRRDVPPHHG